MGDWYEVCFCEDVATYAVAYRNSDTNWSEKRQAITQEQLDAYEEMSQRHAEEMRELLKSFIKEAE